MRFESVKGVLTGPAIVARYHLPGRVEPNIHSHPGALVSARLSVSASDVPTQADAHRRATAQIAPPALALGPANPNRHKVALLLVPDREGVCAPAREPGDGDQREAPAQQGVKRRAQNKPHERIRRPVEDRKGGVAYRHGLGRYRTSTRGLAHTGKLLGAVPL
jgi:hypothetical protein